MPDKDIHFIYNIDCSGSMSEPITYENGRYYSRLEVCINSIIKSLEFLGKLADNGINIYITVKKLVMICAVAVKNLLSWKINQCLMKLSKVLKNYSLLLY